MGLIVYVLKKSGEEEARTLVGASRELVGACVEMSKDATLQRLREIETTALFEPTEDRPAIVLGLGPMGQMVAYDAVPDGSGGWVREMRPNAAGPMANGRWIHCSDSRFPTAGPVRYFDRWEG
jgi:hypothetical protein